MRSLIGYIALGLIIVSCGGDETENQEIIKLESYKDRLSYSFGAEQIRQLAGDPNFKNMDHNMLEEGFEQGLNSNETNLDKDCQTTLQNLLGPYNQDFNVNYAKDGSKCIGKIFAYNFKKSMSGLGGLEKVDNKMMVIGFAHALKKTDTLVKVNERMEIIQKFINEMVISSSGKLFEKVKKIPGIKSIEGGIYIETIQEGTGGSPAATDDVKANYILTSAQGDTIENSIAMQKMNKGIGVPSFNLGGVIAGWTKSFPNLKKGGKYRLYIPSDLAYRNGALCFYVEFIDFGKAGTLVKPTPQMQ